MSEIESMRKYLDYTTWILLFALAPLTILILFSQNSVPGDFVYPVKIGLEDIILAAASVSPSTEVAFRTDLTQRRFTEAQQLLVTKGDTSAYSGFVSEIDSAQQDLSTLSNSQDKIQNSDKLLAKIDQYQAQLNQVQNQIQIAQASQTPSLQTVPQGAPEPQNPASSTTVQASSPTQTTGPLPTAPSQPTSAPPSTVSNTSSPAPQTQSPVSVQNTSTPVSQSSQTPVPTLAPTISTVIASNPTKAEEVKTTIADTQKELEKLKEQVQKDKEDAQFKQKVQDELKKGQENGGKNK